MPLGLSLGPYIWQGTGLSDVTDVQESAQTGTRSCDRHAGLHVRMEKHGCEWLEAQSLGHKRRVQHQGLRCNITSRGPVTDLSQDLARMHCTAILCLTWDPKLSHALTQLTTCGSQPDIPNYLIRVSFLQDKGHGI